MYRYGSEKTDVGHLSFRHVACLRQEALFNDPDSIEFR